MSLYLYDTNPLKNFGAICPHSIKNKHAPELLISKSTGYNGRNQFPVTFYPQYISAIAGWIPRAQVYVKFCYMESVWMYGMSIVMYNH